MSTVSAATTAASTTSAASQFTVAGSQEIAGNFNTFLQLLTTQLQNQDPLSPLDTNQFTEQLVEFASVEQQINENSNLQTLISLQQTSAATQAMQFLGSSVTVNSSAATLANATGQAATWNLNSAAPATGNITITNSSGATVYTGTTTLSTGNQTFSWNGKGNNGITYPDGTYTMAITATGANGTAVTVSPQVQGTVTAVNVSQSPPQVTVGGQSYPISSIQAITNSSLGSLSSLGSSISSLNSSISSLLQLL
jgi:flagellar basal-body rod modification protein FlgD